MRIVAQVTERNVTRLQKGGAAFAVLPNGRTLAGDVRYISKVGRSETRTFRVEVWIDNADGTVLEGLTAELKIPTGSEPAHLVSPALLTLDDKGVMGIKAVSDAGRVVFHPVRILADTPEGIWLGGLPKKLNLITVGQEFVRAGQTVRTKDETAATSMQDDVKG
jgi:multidrug efflux system membrane fusion protein